LRGQYRGIVRAPRAAASAHLFDSHVPVQTVWIDSLEDRHMEIGWIAAIVVGGIAGWLAEQFMKSDMGLLMNIVLGIVGAAVASWLFSLIGVSFGFRLGRLFDRRIHRRGHPDLYRADGPTTGVIENPIAKYL
jgi:uncharacterized membrane protein YeaQ/YmgE (transglycosylase-associated protein family)